MKNRFEQGRWNLATFKGWQWNPSSYNVGGDVDLLIITEYAPLDARLRQVLAKIDNVPAYYAAAKASVSGPTLEHTELAIRQSKGALTVFGPDLMKKVEGSGLSTAEKALFAQRVESAKAAINDYLAYLGALEAKLKVGPARNFRIGKALYEQKFAYDIQSGFTAEQLYRRALAAKEAVAVPRVLDIYSALPSITGKIELEYEGELKGGDAVARELIRMAVGRVYNKYYEGVNVSHIVQWFDLGGALKLDETQDSDQMLRQLGAIQGLLEKVRALGLGANEPDAVRVSAAEFILEGLYAHRRISRSEERGFPGEEKKRDTVKEEEGKRPGYRRPQFN